MAEEIASFSQGIARIDDVDVRRRAMARARIGDLEGAWEIIHTHAGTGENLL